MLGHSLIGRNVLVMMLHGLPRSDLSDHKSEQPISLSSSSLLTVRPLTRGGQRRALYAFCDMDRKPPSARYLLDLGCFFYPRTWVSTTHIDKRGGLHNMVHWSPVLPVSLSPHVYRGQAVFVGCRWTVWRRGHLTRAMSVHVRHQYL